MVSETNFQRYNDETKGEKTKPGEANKYVDLLVVVPSTHHSKVKVVCKKNNCNVDGLNPFIQQWISNPFKFNIHSGWNFKTVEKQQNEKKDDPKTAVRMAGNRTSYVFASITKIIVKQKHIFQILAF